MGTEVDDFLADMLPRQVAAETAIHNGDAAPRLALWSRNDPVTLFGAKASGSGTGWDDLSAIFRTVASWFSDSTGYDFEVVAAGASGDLAYTVGYEHNQREGQRAAPDLHTACHPRVPARGRAMAHRPPTRRRATGCHRARPAVTAPAHAPKLH